jgi:hypothetical protein
MSGGIELPESVVEAFKGRPYLTVRELANALGMSPKTLLRHVAAGNIVGRQIGLGRTRPRRVFALSDVARAKFLSPVPNAPLATSPSTRKRHSPVAAEFMGFSEIIASRRKSRVRNTPE